MGNNYLRGTLPSEIGLLSNMEKLYLDVNKLEGQLPSEIGLMTSLVGKVGSIKTDLHFSSFLPSCFRPIRAQSSIFRIIISRVQFQRSSASSPPCVSGPRMISIHNSPLCTTYFPFPSETLKLENMRSLTGNIEYLCERSPPLKLILITVQSHSSGDDAGKIVCSCCVTTWRKGDFCFHRSCSREGGRRKHEIENWIWRVVSCMHNNSFLALRTSKRSIWIWRRKIFFRLRDRVASPAQLRGATTKSAGLIQRRYMRPKPAAQMVW